MRGFAGSDHSELLLARRFQPVILSDYAFGSTRPTDMELRRTFSLSPCSEAEKKRGQRGESRGDAR